MQRWQEDTSPMGQLRTSRSNAAENSGKILGSEKTAGVAGLVVKSPLQPMLTISLGSQVEPKDPSIDNFASDFTKF